MIEVGLLAAVAAGMLSLLSPCSALLLPSFFAYAFTSKTTLLVRTAAFYVGLLLTLVPLGTGAGAASTIFYGHRQQLIAVAGWSIILMGLILVFGRGFAMPFAGRLQAFASARSRPGAGLLSTVLLGAVYGLAGFCSGPVLGAILTMAATRGPAHGGVLLAAYALGMAAPLFFLAALWDRFDLGNRSVLRGRMLTIGPLQVHSTSLVSGLLLIVIGALFLRFDGTAGITGMLGLGDTTDLEFTLQQRVAELTNGVPAWAVTGALALVAGLWVMRRARRRDVGSSESEPRDGAASPAEEKVKR